MHFPEPMPAFDVITAEVPYTAIGANTTRVFVLPTTLGIEHRILNGRVYITAIPVTDPAEIQRRLALFQQRAGYYYENWDRLYEGWKARMEHPGYGFLAENPRLAEACAAAGVVFVGPTAAQLDAVGDKLRARAHAVAAGLAVLPGGQAGGPEAALRLAREVGWPVMVKAVGGGGGRGLRVVEEPGRLAETIRQAPAEAGAAFGDPRVYLERFVASGRHVEVQLLGDGETVVHLGDRDCSIQRRHQRLVEAPAPGLDERLRERMRQAAVALGGHLSYRGLGTVEFLVDRELDAFYFLEMNARIQVEHPVTEEVFGLDLVAEQIAVAEGRPLRLAQAEVRPAGHAIECRINAEDPARGFRPSPGTVTSAVFPVGDGIRVDPTSRPARPCRPGTTPCWPS